MLFKLPLGKHYDLTENDLIARVNSTDKSMGEVIMPQNKLSLLNTIAQQHYSNIYELDVEKQFIVEYSVSSMEELGILIYEEWLHKIIVQLQFIQIKPFTEQMQIQKILQELENDSLYIVEYQSMQGNNSENYQMVFCYADTGKNRILITRQGITKHKKKQYEHIIEVEKDSARFRFIISHLCENFGEIHVRTGNTWMTTCNDWKVSQGNLKAQIEWFAENLIVPEQKEAYLKDFEMDNLLNLLHQNDGFYAPTYEANCPDGRRYLLIINALMSNLENPEEDYIFSCVQDITQLKTQEEKNKHLIDISQELLTLSQIDPMTKLYNRIAGEKQIGEYLQVKSKYAMGALLIIDIDYFKKFNDQYGHPVGDSVLKYLASTMKKIFRSSDSLCRFGGDEFVVFMPDVSSRTMVEDLIEKLRKEMCSHRINQLLLPITLSIGVIIFKQAKSFKHLYEEADKYLYQAKSAGRDNYQIVVKD